MSSYNLKLSQKLARLRKIPKGEIPNVLYYKISRFLSRAMEKNLYTPKGKKIQLDKSHSGKIKHTQLFHADVLTPGFADLFKETFQEESKELIEDADKAVNLVFDLLGSGEIDLREFRDRKDLKSVSEDGSVVPSRVYGRVPWHYDFKAGIGWDPNTFFGDIKFGHVPGLDIKVPWELSRSEHFVTLGQAYRLTHDEKYAQAFLNQIEDWIEQNPIKYGVNWVCPMDIAIRACNWLLALELFSDSHTIPESLHDTLKPILKEHGHHVFRHLETGGGTPSNHYVSDLVGLAYLGLTLKVPKWTKFARSKLKHEILRQIHEDGMDYEGSTMYHRLIVELFLYYSILESRTLSSEIKKLPEALEKKCGKAFVARLRAMVETTSALAHADGSYPSVGDNDSGRFHVFYRRPDQDMRYLSHLGALFFKEADLKVDDWAIPSDVVWIYGFSGYENLRSLPGKKAKDRASRGPSSSNLLILRGEEDELTFSAQPMGTGGIGNHTHNDRLSFTLRMKGEDFIVDPGSGVYTPNVELRNVMRSTLSHNTICVDGEEQNRFVATFLMEDDAKIKIHEWEDGVKVRAHHTGYKRLEHPIIHERTLERLPGQKAWHIHDKLKGKGQHKLVWSFVLAPHIRVDKESNSLVRLRGENGGIEITVNPDRLNFYVEDGTFSPAYGIGQHTPILRWVGTEITPFDIDFHLQWKDDLKK